MESSGHVYSKMDPSIDHMASTTIRNREDYSIPRSSPLTFLQAELRNKIFEHCVTNAILGVVPVTQTLPTHGMA